MADRLRSAFFLLPFKIKRVQHVIDVVRARRSQRLSGRRVLQSRRLPVGNESIIALIYHPSTAPVLLWWLLIPALKCSAEIGAVVIIKQARYRIHRQRGIAQIACRK